MMLLYLEKYPYRMEVQQLLAAGRAAERQRSRSIAVDALHNVKEILEELESGSRNPTPINQISGSSGQPLLTHVKRALQNYSQRGIFSRSSKQTRDALPHLN